MNDMEGVGVVAAGSGTLALIGRSLWSKFFDSERRANDALVQQLSERITAQEARLVTLETGLDDERAARRAAETTVYELRMQIMRLEFELSKHGIAVPEAPKRPSLFDEAAIQAVQT